MAMFALSHAILSVSAGTGELRENHATSGRHTLQQNQLEKHE
jgi:hypothetical protein